MDNNSEEIVGSGFRPIYLKLPPENIVHLKFVIESYEGIAEVRTLDSHCGEIVLLALADTEEVVRSVLSTLSERLSIAELQKPDSLDGDWLLTEG